MKTRNTLIGLGIAGALAAAVGAYAFTAAAQSGPGYGWGMMGGYGPGYHMGWGGGPGPGAGFGPGNCPPFAQANNGGPGYGPGYRMRGWRGGYGPGMMWGNGGGPGYNRDAAQGNQNLNLTTDDVKTRMERWLAVRGNARLKLGEVKEKDADTITADIVTKDNSLVERFIFNRHTGAISRDNS
jgi:hypothetical protein